MQDFVFITDLHFKASSNNRQFDLLEDLCLKLQFVVDYCNRHNAILLIGGDLFDRPSVPDLVKNRLAKILLGLKESPICISGNHDRLYDNPEFNFKTSYATLATTRVIRDIDNSFVIECGGVVITNELPIPDYGKPTIGMYHGFLNIADGRNTFRFTDIQSHSQQLLVLLGHDHIVHDDLVLDDKTTILRPGSFQRCTRDDCERIPQMVHISIVDQQVSYKYVPITTARNGSEIFKTKVDVSSVDISSISYDDIIKSLSEVQSKQISFLNVVNSIATPEVAAYLEQILTQCKSENATKRQNL